MKKLLLIAILAAPSLASDFTLYKAGVAQTPGYAKPSTAALAAVYLSQSCKCEIIIKTADVKVNARPEIISSSSSSSISSASVSSSSSSSSVAYVLGTAGATLKWSHPTQRENGQALAVSEITGYKIRYKLPTETIYKTIDVAGTLTSYEYTQNAVGVVFEIACVTSSLSSDFTVMVTQ